ncbi:MAG: hypothetical protein LBN24_13445 [Mediterranea sp.]|jgi:hypothetical protein|nr:hypothetical protein [Mediterranea sp.]
MEVLNEVFDDLIKEMGALSVFETPPPMPFLGNNESMGYDTCRYNKEMEEFKEWNRRMKDTTLVIAVSDTLFSCYNLRLNIKYIESQLAERSYIEALNSMTDASMVSYPLNLSRIESRRHIKLRYSSEFPKGRDIWKEDYDFPFLGILRVSRIYFDREKRTGLLYSSYACGRLCGEDAIICIRKVNGKWSIEKHILLGVY